MTTPHVSIIGSALSGNKGAAAMLESSLATLSTRLPGVRFTLFSMYPDRDRAQNTYEHLDIVDARPRQLGVTINSLALLYRLAPFLRPLLRRRSAAVRALSSSQVLLDQGGITFTDGREKFLLYNVASILPALNVGTPVFKCAQAVGPFRGRLNRAAAKAFLPRVDTIVTRGRITHEHAEELGLENLAAGADYAFSLDLGGDEEEAAAEHVDPSFFDRPVLGLSPSVVVRGKVEARGEDYVAMMVDFVDRTTASGTPVLLVPHSARSGTDATHNNDLPLCREIAARVRDRDLVVAIDEELPSQVLRWLIGRCDVFVASRFHAMVSSLAMGVPTVVVGWGHKYEEVLEMFGAQEWAFGHEELSAEFLSRRVHDLRAERRRVLDLLEHHLPDVRRRSAAQADLIADVVRRELEGRPGSRPGRRRDRRR